MSVSRWSGFISKYGLYLDIMERDIDVCYRKIRRLYMTVCIGKLLTWNG